VRVPLAWLREYVDIDMTPEQLAERLTLLGMEVKALERWGADWRGVVTGELLEVARHPRADRLSLTRVRVGNDVLEIVCGATNIAPGQRVPVALPGARLPGDRTIERTERLGVISNGMLCSGDELRLTGDAEGILILPLDTPVGLPLVDLYGDAVLDVDVKPNRGDVLSLVGLAREVAAITGAPVRFPEVRLREGAGPRADQRLTVAVADPRLCSRFVGRWIDGVTSGPSPDGVQMRLLAAGMRPVSNVVDATNYVMLELGKPIHAFDAAAIARDEVGRCALHVRLARPGERLATLDHVERELPPETLLIADPEGPLAIAGVMGGAASEVSASTTDLVLESAVFDPVSIRRTAFRFGLRSEASLRFEKGQEARMARIGADRAAELIVAWAGGEAAAGRVDTAPEEPPSERVPFRPGRVNRLLGTAYSEAEQAALLERVGIVVESAGSGAEIAVAGGEKPVRVTATEPALVAVVPTWRRDLQVEADVAEEVARIAGYDTVPTKTPDTAMPRYRPDPLERREAVRLALVGAGLVEVVTPALVPATHQARLGWPVDAADGVPGCDALTGRVIRVRNPLSERHAVLRQGLVGSLLDVLALNVRHGRADVAIFEIGKGYASDGTAAAEWWRLGMLLAGASAPPSWTVAPRYWDLEDAKALAALVAHVLGLARPSFEPYRAGPPLHPGRAARVVGPGEVAGLLGELHPTTLSEWDLPPERVYVAELAVAGLAEGQLTPVQVPSLERHSAVERDLALVVAEDVPAGLVADTLRRAGGAALSSVDLFDVYRGAPLASGEKSLAWRLRLQGNERVPAGVLAEDLVAALVEAVGREHGGRLRT
jgi:phenylalanyl-tRNA synthetase beta chain